MVLWENRGSMSSNQNKSSSFNLSGRRPDFQRFLTALNRQEPDRLPFAEFIVEPDIRAAFLGHPARSHVDHIKFFTQAGYDYYPIAMSIVDPGRALGGQAAKSFSIYDHAYTERTWAANTQGVITTSDDFLSYPFPSVEDMDLGILDEITPLLPDGMQIIVIIGKLYTANWLLQGAETFYKNIKLNIELVEMIYDKIIPLQFEVFERVVGHPNVGAIWHPDDMAGNSGPLVNPDHLRKYVFPWYKKMGNICRQLGKPMIFHSDGDITTLLDTVIEAEFSGIHPIDPNAMDINQVNKAYGDRLALLGNINMDFPLSRGKPADVEELVLKRIHDLAPGGGYLLSTSNSVAEYIPLENYKAMLLAGHKYGQYPIRV
jgi:uroporphyrinogen decarboxylase